MTWSFDYGAELVLSRVEGLTMTGALPDGS